MVRKSISIAAATGGKLTPIVPYPCGACLQVLSEYETKGGQEIKVILGSAGNVLVMNGIGSFLPVLFDSLNKE